MSAEMVEQLHAVQQGLGKHTSPPLYFCPFILFLFSGISVAKPNIKVLPFYSVDKGAIFEATPNRCLKS